MPQTLSMVWCRCVTLYWVPLLMDAPKKLATSQEVNDTLLVANFFADTGDFYTFRFNVASFGIFVFF